MNPAANQRPPDTYALEARLAAALTERDAAVAERNAAPIQNDRLMHLLRQLQRMQFGRKSEKLDPDQFALALEDVEQAIAASEAADDKRDKAAAAARAEKRRAVRGALPTHLPRVHVTIEPEDRTCPCCRAPMHAMGADVSERLDVIPAQFRVLVTRRPKYACRACEEAVVQAPAPERLIKGGLPTEAMVASVLVVQICLASAALPTGPDAGRPGPRHQALDAGVLGRLRGRRTQAGLRAPSRTHPDLGQDRCRRDQGAGARSRPRPGQGRATSGRSPATIDHGAARTLPAIAFAYAPGRGAIHGLKLLDNYAGVVQCDGYAAYKTIAAKAPDGRITLAFCWSHLRRRFFDHAKGEAPIAREALESIAELYAIEKTIRGRAPTSVAARARRRASRSSWRSGLGSSSSWRASPASPGSPRIFAMA